MTADAITFLRLFHPTHLWVLTAIPPQDRSAIVTQSFDPAKPGEVAAAREWIEARNGRANLYHTANVVGRAMTKKPKKGDISEAVYLHIDLDPAAGEAQAAARTRLLGVLNGELPAGVPPPTAVVASGGGAQAYWKLAKPVRLGGLAATEAFEQYNRGLERAFGSDATHNVDRLMRLPGTINLPDPRKAAKGRVAAPAELVLFEASRTYPLTRFKPEPKGTHSDRKAGAPPEAERLKDLSDLDRYNVPERIKTIIAQGSDPGGEPHPDSSRSGWLFAATCGLLRCDVPEDLIFAIITDPAWAISACVLDKPDPRGAARRTISRAKDLAIAPELAELNGKYAVIADFGGRCRIVFRSFESELGRDRLVVQPLADFKASLSNRKISVGRSTIQLGVWWLDHPQRRQFDSIAFAPGRETPLNVLNLWCGFAVTPAPGNLDESFIGHVRSNICSGDTEAFEYVMNWMARAVQKPASPGEVALVLRGDQGSGKGVLARNFGRLFGQHFLHVSHGAHLTGRFNSHLRDVVVLFADEAFFSGDRAHVPILKALVTEPTLAIEQKFVDVRTAPNYVHLIMASNDQHVVIAGPHERRYQVLDVGSDRLQDTAYFAAIDRDMEAGGFANLLHQLLARDLSGFDVRKVIKTAALTDQKIASLRQPERATFEALASGEAPTGAVEEVVGSGRPWVGTRHLAEQIARRSPRDHVNETNVGRVLELIGEKARWSARKRSSGETANNENGTYWPVARERGFTLLPLPEARARWDQERFMVAWDDTTDWLVCNELAM